MSSAQSIKLGPDGGIAPTPQNTPAAHLSHSVMSRPQVPSTLSEEVEEEPASLAATKAALSNNPLFAQMVQGKLSSLIGKSSGYVESLPAPVQRRITSLKGLQAAHSDIEAEFQKEVYELEKKYAAKYAPLYATRQELVTGVREPTQEEVTKGEEADSDDEDEEDSDDEDGAAVPKAPLPEPTAEEIKAAPKGIPEFWLTALKNHVGLSELITEKDEAILAHLVDVKVSYPADKPGFTLVFTFSKEGAAEFWDGPETLEKTYYYQDEVGYEGDFVYDHAVGTDIAWKGDKNPTVKIETKKQRNRNTNQTRIVKKSVPTESFFSFFKPPTPPSDEDDEEDEDEEDDIDERLELDYQIGEDLKERIVPRAIDFFTGKALRYEQDAGSFGSDDEFTEEDEDDEGGDDDEDDEDDEPRGGKRKALAPPPSGVTPASQQDPQECKQQ